MRNVNLQPNPGMGQGSQGEANYMNLASPVTHINNKTYVTNAVQSPAKKTPNAQSNDDYSFSNMTIMSPSKPLPLASSTLIQVHIPQEAIKEEEEEKPNFKNSTLIS